MTIVQSYLQERLVKFLLVYDKIYIEVSFIFMFVKSSEISLLNISVFLII